MTKYTKPKYPDNVYFVYMFGDYLVNCIFFGYDENAAKRYEPMMQEAPTDPIFPGKRLPWHLVSRVQDRSWKSVLGMKFTRGTEHKLRTGNFKYYVL